MSRVGEFSNDRQRSNTTMTASNLLIAHSNPDLWSGNIRARLDRTERGATFAGPVYTGSDSNGTKRGECFGNSKTEFGTSDQTDNHWALIFGDSAAKPHPVYALSDPLTIISADSKNPAKPDNKFQ